MDSKKIPSEHDEQVMFVQWMKRTHPGIKFFAIPNAGKRSARVAAMMKAEGMSAGVPDLFFPSLNLWVEMKRVKGGRLSPAQIEWFGYLESIGHNTFVAYGADAAIEKLTEYIREASK